MEAQCRHNLDAHDLCCQNRYCESLRIIRRDSELIMEQPHRTIVKCVGTGARRPVKLL
jgi:hypothetical protein